MKIGIVTITTGSNFGNRLQNYALQTIIEKNGYNVETIKNYPNRKSIFYLKKIIKNILYGKAHRNRERKFEKFNKQYIKFSRYEISNNQINKKANNQYDYYICGSDQIWNPSYKENGSANFLFFSNYEKNIAYAPSFGTSKIPQERINEYQKWLKNIKNLSVRENAGAEIIKELTNKDVSVLVDPTFLLTKDEWLSIAKSPSNMPKTKYILNYFLGTINEKRKSEIERIATENECVIINVLDKKDSFYKTDPSEFLYLTSNAFLICTDSFHSCIFSIIFNRPFLVFGREDKTISMNSRIDTLLKKLKLENKKVDNKIENHILNHDYTEAYQIIKKEKEKSEKFLKQAIK